MINKKYAILSAVLMLAFIVIGFLILANESLLKQVVLKNSELDNPIYNVKLHRISSLPYEMFYSAAMMAIITIVILHQERTYKLIKDAGTRRLFIFGIVLISVFFLATNIYYINHIRVLGPDEGFHINNAKLVYSGMVPYLDFPYLKGFIYPYIQGLLMNIVGFSFLSSRLLALAYKAVTLVLVFFIARQLGGKHGNAAGFMAMLLYTMNIGILSFFAGEFPGGPSTMLFATLAFFLLASKIKDQLKVILTSITLVILVDIRLLAAPLLILFLIYLLIEHKHFLLGLGITAASYLAIYLIPLLLQPERTFNGIIGYTINRASFQTVLQMQTVLGSDITTITGQLRDKVINLVLAVEFYNMLLFLTTIVILVFLVLFVRDMNKSACQSNQMKKSNCLTAIVDKYKSSSQQDKILLLMIISSIGFISGALILNPTTFYYAAPLLPILAIFASVLVLKLSKRLKDQDRTILIAVIILASIISPMLQYPREQYVIREGKVINVLEEIGTVGAYISSVTKPDDFLMTFETPFAVAADRKVLPGMERSIFLYSPMLSDEKTSDLGIVNTNKLVAYLEEKKAGAVVMSRLYTYDTLKLTPEDFRRTNASLYKNYYLVKRYDEFLDWGTTDFFLAK